MHPWLVGSRDFFSKTGLIRAKLGWLALRPCESLIMTVPEHPSLLNLFSPGWLQPWSPTSQIRLMFKRL